MKSFIGVIKCNINDDERIYIYICMNILIYTCILILQYVLLYENKYVYRYTYYNSK